MKVIKFAVLMVLLLLVSLATAQQDAKCRVIVLTDIEADPDDTQSLVRLLLYSNQIDIRGLIATTSCWQQHRISPESIGSVIKAYGLVHSRLLEHEKNFPPEEKLEALIKKGSPVYGMLGVGKGKDTEGSDWIVNELKRDDPRPLWISVWGGANTLAQALFYIQESYSKEEVTRLISKLRVYTISDQDDSGIWIRNTFPNLFYIVSPGDHYGSASWTGINHVVRGINNETISNTWIAENIQQGHGPLGAVYPDVAWGVEGDTPAFLGLVPNGLNDPEHPHWGGWGGRYELYLPDFSAMKEGSSVVEIAPETRAIWTNATDSYNPYDFHEFGRTVRPDTTAFVGYRETLWRWRDDFQYDFAARMDWTTRSYEDANHPPIPRLNHGEKISLKSGEGFLLSAFPSTDPDGDNLSFLWFHYPEAGNYVGEIEMGAENVHSVHMTAPHVDKVQTAHFIVRVTDKGTPRLSRYKRVIVEITPH
ncbi:MAG: DUF1593 domain-containing protein [Saprospiraceae bacterium]|nr:DUF1593 domain-containing protein [Saprospiraceae bacterium]